MIEIQELYEAYRKLKSYFYYDNTSLFTRKKIAEFESKFHSKANDDSKRKFKLLFKSEMSDLLTVVNNEGNWEEIWNGWLKEDVDCIILPKEISDQTNPDITIMYVNNKTNEKEVKVKSVNALIDASIKIHIVSVLWIMKVGLRLSQLVDSNNYAYQLATHENNEDEKEIDNGLAIYKPYFTGYQRWRDNALKRAKCLLNEKKDVAIVSLDIKRYFYSARLNVADLVGSLSSRKDIDIDPEDEEIKKLNALLNDIHRTYAEKAGKYVKEAGIENNRYSIPVGLMSSGLLGNLYIEDFDRKVTEYIRPDYYGRYVDDTIFVFSNVEIESPIDFINKMFCDKECALLKKEGEDEYSIIDHTNLKLQSSKIVLEYFEPSGSSALIDKFVHNIMKNSSEFRFLPDEEEVNRDFEDYAFSMQYSDSFNKLRSIENFKEDKFGAACYLANQIFLSRYKGDDIDSEKNDRQIHAFFRGNIAISFYTLWEKVATYFIINNNENGLATFIANVQKAINCVSIDGDYDTKKLSQDLSAYLSVSIATPLSLNLSFKLRSQDSNGTESLAVNILKSCMSRRQLINIGLFDMMKDTAIKGTCYYHIDPMTYNADNLHYSDFKRLLCPQYIHLDMLCQIEMMKKLALWGSDKKDSYNNVSKNDLTQKVLDESIEEFYNFNYAWRHLFENKKERNWMESYIKQSYDNPQKHYVVIKEKHKDNKTSTNKCVAIANLKVDTDMVRKMMYGKPNLTTERKRELFAVINEAVKHNSDLLVMPELATPYQWLSMLSRESMKANMAIVSGLTYICNSNKTAFNVVVTVLPMKIGNRMECVILPRVKNHYAPKEVEILKGYRYRVPKFKSPVYQLIHWRNLYFSIYNCFELASIEDRSLFKSETDLIIATELNRDLTYFSDIAGSWVRDFHSYFIQVNSSEFGDSRIMRPAGKDRRDMVVVKGGKNPIAIIDNIDIHSLRDFQLKEYSLQMQNKDSFKLTPPNYDKEKVIDRVNDKEMW